MALDGDEWYLLCLVQSIQYMLFSGLRVNTDLAVQWVTSSLAAEQLKEEVCLLSPSGVTFMIVTWVGRKRGYLNWTGIMEPRLCATRLQG